MSIEARAMFMKTMETQLSDKFTVNQTTEMMRILSDAISNYVIEDSKSVTEDDGKDDLYNAYMSAMKVQGLSDKTLWRYDYVLRKLFTATPGINSSHMTVYHIRNYLQNEKERGISDVTLNGFRLIYSAYFGWLHREGLIPIDPTTNIGAIKCPKRLKKVYSGVDIEKINSKVYTSRNKAIVHTLESTGCRISELVDMNISDVNLDTMEITVIGKGDKERTVYVDDVTVMFIREYLSTRSDSCEALFIGQHGGRLTPGGVRFMLRKVAKKAGVEGVHPHKFRRTLATNLNKRGMPVQEIAEILGHEHIDTTMEYICIDKSAVKNSYHKYS